jgi:hypothetical protein
MTEDEFIKHCNSKFSEGFGPNPVTKEKLKQWSGILKPVRGCYVNVNQNVNVVRQLLSFERDVRQQCEQAKGQGAKTKPRLKLKREQKLLILGIFEGEIANGSENSEAMQNLAVWLGKSSRQVERYLSDARKHRGKQETLEARLAETLVDARRRKEQQRKFVQEWKIQLCHPSPQYALVGRGNKFPDDFGPLGTVRSVRYEDCCPPLHRVLCWTHWGEESSLELSCPVEKEECFDALCKARLSSPKFWNNYTLRKKQDGRYLVLCAQLYEQIEDEAKEKTSLEKISDFARMIYKYTLAYWVGNGVFWTGAPGDSVFYFYSHIKCWYEGAKPPPLLEERLWLPLPGVEIQIPPKSLPREETVGQLKLENTLLTSGPLKQLKKYRGIFYSIVLRYPKRYLECKDSGPIGEILKLDNDLVKLEKEICAGLDKALQEGTHLGDIDA